MLKKEKIIGKLSTQGNFIVAYPPEKALNFISQDTIFPYKDLKKEKEVALYVHIPFCTGKCGYCSYTSFINPNINETDKYLKYVKKELELYIENTSLNVRSLFIGGGTPTYLKKEQLSNFLDYLKKKLNIEKDIEITIEASPETIDNNKLRILTKYGVNRLSIGVQSFDDNILRFIGRRHTCKQAIEKFMIAKNYFDHINIDIMYGLPNQKLKDWEDTLISLIKLKPASITTYYTRIKSNSAFSILLKSASSLFPSEEEVNKMRKIAIKMLNDAGYKQNPVDWFCLDGFKHKQQTQKWQENSELLGIGLSSYSFINNCQYYNYKNLSDYYGTIEESRFPIMKGKKLSKEELIRRRIIFGLKILPTGVKISDEDYNLVKNIVENLIKHGFVKFHNSYLRLTEQGVIYSDEVATQFFSNDVKEKLN